MSDPVDHLQTVGELVRELRGLGAYFVNAETGLRVDLLFDFPIPAATLGKHATRLTIRRQVFDVASEQDLLRLKRIAKKARSAPGDTEDIAFLERRRKGRGKVTGDDT